MEKDSGLTEFLGTRDVGVPCILKHLYSDFVVQEIAADKTVARLVHSSEVLTEVEEEYSAVEDESVEYPEKVSAETRNAISQVFTKQQRSTEISTTGMSKDERKAIHECIRKRFRNYMSSETKPDLIVVKRSSPQSHGAANRWNKENGDFLHFTLGKENKETSYALGIISKFLRIKGDMFKSCGMKDRRAVTSQRISVFRVSKEKLMALNKHLRGICVYDCEFADQPLQLGKHWGNRFNIILRGIPSEVREILDSRMKELSTDGFINYFGTQRFGACGTKTAEVGKLILGRKWEEAVRMLLNNPEAKGTVGDALKVWLESGDAEQARRQLKGGTSYASIEGNLLKSLSNGRTWQEAILYLPFQIRSLYVHAYQSLLWNKVASRRVRESGLSIQEGDVGKTGEPLTKESSPQQVHIPLPVLFGDGEKKEHYAMKYYSEMLSEDGLTLEAISSLDDRFSLGECYRAVFVLPEDVEWNFVSYEEPNTVLQNGLSDKATENPSGSKSALRVQFSLPSGAYATVALRQITAYDMSKQSMKDLVLDTGNGDVEELIPIPSNGNENEILNEEEVEDAPDAKRARISAEASE